MKKAFEWISRSIALVLLVTVSFMSCSIPGDSSDGPPPPLKLTPGVGTPHSFYLDSQGNYIETETSGPGRTGLVIENNKLAEGVLIYSDDTDSEDRVAFVYQNSIVSMFFKKNSNFPHRMAITDGSDVYYAYLSKYNTVNHTYYVTFLHNSVYDMMGQVVLNENIFSLYQKDPELSDSQNRRMANMTIAMGVWGSLYATFEQLNSTPGFYIPRGMFSSFLKTTAKVFSNIAVAAAVVAFVVAPIVTFINPVAGLALEVAAISIGKFSVGISAAAYSLALLIDALEDANSGQSQTPTVPAGGPLAVYVSRVEPNENVSEIKYNVNGVHEEFHIPPGKDLVIEFYIPYGNFSKVTKETLKEGAGFMFYYEPGVKKGDRWENYSHFRNPPADIVELSPPDPERFRIKIMRSPSTGCNGVPGTEYYGKVNFGFVFHDDKGKPMDIIVNGYDGGFKFRFSQDDEPVLYKNMVVIHFCEIENCPDAKSK